MKLRLLIASGLIVALLVLAWFVTRDDPTPPPVPTPVEAPLPDAVDAEQVEGWEALVAQFLELRERVQGSETRWQQEAAEAGVDVSADLQQWQPEREAIQALVLDQDVPPSTALAQQLVAFNGSLDGRQQQLAAQLSALTLMQRERDSAEQMQRRWQQQATRWRISLPGQADDEDQQRHTRIAEHTAALALVDAARLWRLHATVWRERLAALDVTLTARQRAQQALERWQPVQTRSGDNEAARQARQYQAAGNDALRASDWSAAQAAFASAETRWQEARRRGLVSLATPTLVEIPAGRFRMGDLQGDGRRDEQPVMEREVAAFRLAATEVTFDQYQAYAELSGVAVPKDEGWGQGRRPVIHLSWDEAMAYAAWLRQETGIGFRLPTEAEWEYAARAGTDTAYSWGGTMVAGVANCEGCSRWNNDRTDPVASHAANRFGLYDMAGNVWEWVADCYRPRYDLPEPEGECAARVLRGGSWSDLPPVLRAANRSWAEPGQGNNRIGVRLAASP